MRAYSSDLRERIIKAFDSGLPKSVVCRTFQVSRSTLNSYLELRRDTGDIKPRPSGGDRRSEIAPADYPALRAQLQASPDATLVEHCDTWERSHGVRLSIFAMCRAIRRVGWTRKKRHNGRLSRTPLHASSGAKT